MHNRIAICSLPLFALAACHGKVAVGDEDASSGDNVHIAMKDVGSGGSAVSVNVPGFKANVALPGLDIGNHVDLDGITLAPDTKVSDITVDADDHGSGKHDRGVVRLSFSNPLPPAAVLDHYARSAAAAGYTDIARAAGSVGARKERKSFAVAATPDGHGSKGMITMQDQG